MKNIARLLARATCWVVPVLVFLFTFTASADVRLPEGVTTESFGDNVACAVINGTPTFYATFRAAQAANDASEDGLTIYCKPDVNVLDVANQATDGQVPAALPSIITVGENAERTFAPSPAEQSLQDQLDTATMNDTVLIPAGDNGNLRLRVNWGREDNGAYYVDTTSPNAKGNLSIDMQDDAFTVARTIKNLTISGEEGATIGAFTVDFTTASQRYANNEDANAVYVNDERIVHKHFYLSMQIDTLVFEDLHFTGLVHLENSNANRNSARNVIFRNCTFSYSGFQLNGNSQFANCLRTGLIDGLTIENCVFTLNDGTTANNGAAIYSAQDTSITIKNCGFTGNGKNHIQFSGALKGDMVITNNTFGTVGDRTIRFSNDKQSVDTVAKLTITDNTFNGGHDDSGEFMKIQIVNQDKLVLRDNVYNAKQGYAGTLVQGLMVNEVGEVLDENLRVPTPVAKIGETTYTSFADAIKDADDWTTTTTIELLADVDLDADGYYSPFGAVIIDLKGHTLQTHPVWQPNYPGDTWGTWYGCLFVMNNAEIRDSADGGKLLGGADSLNDCGMECISITGGTFDFDPIDPITYVNTDDYTISTSTVEGRTYWTVTRTTPVENVAENDRTSVQYTSLKDAIEAASNGDVIKLLADCTDLPGNVSDKAVGILLDGKNWLEFPGSTIREENKGTCQCIVNMKDGYLIGNLEKVVKKCGEENSSLVTELGGPKNDRFVFRITSQNAHLEIKNNIILPAYKIDSNTSHCAYIVFDGWKEYTLALGNYKITQEAGTNVPNENEYPAILSYSSLTVIAGAANPDRGTNAGTIEGAMYGIVMDGGEWKSENGPVLDWTRGTLAVRDAANGVGVALRNGKVSMVWNSGKIEIPDCDDAEQRRIAVMLSGEYPTTAGTIQFKDGVIRCAGGMLIRNEVPQGFEVEFSGGEYIVKEAEKEFISTHLATDTECLELAVGDYLVRGTKATVTVTAPAGKATPVAMPFADGTMDWKTAIDTTNLTGNDNDVNAATAKIPNGSGAYVSYYLDGSKVWRLLSGESEECETVRTGDAIWITNPTTADITIRGSVAPITASLEIVQGLNMVSFPVIDPNVTEVDINALEWPESTAPYDRIEVVGGKGKISVYHYIDGLWVDTSLPVKQDVKQKKIGSGQGIVFFHDGVNPINLRLSNRTVENATESGAAE